MIFNEDELNKLSEKLKISLEELTDKVESITEIISNPKKYNFINRNITYNTPSINGKLQAVSSPFKVGDTVLISQSKYNDGIYVIKDMDGSLNKDLYNDDYMKITLLQYPKSVKSGVIKLLEYEYSNITKKGIKSESLGRHSVTYDNYSNDYVIDGYPSKLMSFLEPYKRARF